MTTMPDLGQAAKLIAEFEGYRSKPYLDTGGVATVGYGSTHYPDGTPVKLTDLEIQPSVALNMLMHDLAKTAHVLWAAIKRQPTSNQWAALLSIAYNVGTGAIVASTLLRDFNAGDTAGAADQFLRWDHDNGQVVHGLTVRRMKERQLFLKAD